MHTIHKTFLHRTPGRVSQALIMSENYKSVQGQINKMHAKKNSKKKKKRREVNKKKKKKKGW